MQRQEPFLQRLPLNRRLAAIGADVTLAPLVRALESGLQQLRNPDNEKAPNLIDLADIPERLQWKVDDKLEKIEKSLGFGKKFADKLGLYLKITNVTGLNRQATGLGWFNEHWNTATLGKPLATAATEVKLRQLGCFDEHDAWDDAKAVIVFQHIIDRDQAWLDEVVKLKPASAADKLKGRDPRF